MARENTVVFAPARTGAAARKPTPTRVPKISSTTRGLRYWRAMPRPITGSETPT
jgi:hypothetical protein